MYQFNFDFNQFLATYWHKQPVIIKNAFADFKDPISPDEIAGLAMEQDVDSRFVSNQNSNWLVEHGPFEHFDHFSDSHCQLIVQAADHWHQGLRQLAAPFRVLPNWLFDDVMICLSMPEGGVGPHIDQYDVFIIQGQGKRHWRVGPKGEYKETNLETGLLQIEGFDSIIDDILEPGDMLYIPPGFPHEGTSLEISLSYSVGYRSPKKQELLSHFADHVLNNELGNEHYINPQLQARNQHGIIKSAEYNELNDMLQALISDDQIKRRWLGEQLSLSRHELDIMPAEPAWQWDELNQFLCDDLILEKVSGLKTLYHEDKSDLIFINGETIALSPNSQKAITALCDQESFTGKDLGELIKDPTLQALLLSLCNQGYWYPQA